MKDDVITFKGVKEGIFIDIKSGNLHLVKEELDEKLKDSIVFFQGAKSLGVRGKDLTHMEINEIKSIIKDKYNLSISVEGLPEYLNEENILDDLKESFNNPLTDNDIFQGIEEGMTKFINGTLRSGQVVEYSGNIVIVGDVNPGALIKAKGNIVVLGTLRGVAHAGIDGNLEAIVAAYNLQPTQLRIADKIARPPDENIISYKLPEVAKVHGGEVMIEPYLPKK